jgi:membrane protein implicated in regulation of membrane protease activity
MKTTEKPTRNVDRIIGRLVLRFWAVVAFLAAAGSMIFGAVVLVDGHPLPGIMSVALGALFLWLGRRAWRDRATLGDLLNRDFEGPGAGRSS